MLGRILLLATTSFFRSAHGRVSGAMPQAWWTSVTNRWIADRHSACEARAPRLPDADGSRTRRPQPGFGLEVLTVCPAKSTNILSPVRCSRRITSWRFDANARYCNPLGVGHPVLVPQQREHHPLATKLAMDLAPLRQWARRPPRRRRRHQHPPLKRRIVERSGQWPSQFRTLCTGHVSAHRRRRYAKAWYIRRTSRTSHLDDLRFATVNPPQTRKDPTASGLSRVAQLQGSDPRTIPSKQPGSRRSDTGITVQFRPESVSSLHRNTHLRRES